LTGLASISQAITSCLIGIEKPESGGIVMLTGDTSLASIRRRQGLRLILEYLSICLAAINALLVQSIRGLVGSSLVEKLGGSRLPLLTIPALLQWSILGYSVIHDGNLPSCSSRRRMLTASLRHHIISPNYTIHRPLKLAKGAV